MLSAEAFKCRTLLRAGMLQKIACRLAQQRHLEPLSRRVIYVLCRTRQRAKAFMRDPALIGQPLQAYAQRISGKCGSRAVGRIADSSRTHRKDLPEGLSCGHQEIEELVSRRARVAHAAARRQRPGMRRDYAGTWKSDRK